MQVLDLNHSKSSQFCAIFGCRPVVGPSRNVNSAGKVGYMPDENDCMPFLVSKSSVKSVRMAVFGWFCIGIREAELGS